jgi:3-methyladenine DNA glycosylase/8-oxoguanine DNA glycosylase
MTPFRLPVPADFILARDVCSYGYFLLEPNHWDPAGHTFRTTIDLGPRAVTLRISQGAVPDPERTHTYRSIREKAGTPLSVRPDAKLSPEEKKIARRAIERMLHLNETQERIGEFHKLDKRFRKTGRGRLMRSATLFEDVLKTVTSCNVQWPSTIIMNRRLCEVVGRESASGLHAFPTAERLAAMRPASLRARCRVGYRDARMIELARMFARGEIDPAWIENPATPDDDLWDALLEWPGIGPYAAANIMQLLGRYHRLPLDTESVRHGRDLLGFKGSSARIMKRVHRHYEPFGQHRFRSYWFELWEFYERKRGPAWTWERETTGKTFTASQLADEPRTK